MQTFQTALYIRLSKEDEQEGESGSIKNQRALLWEFVSRHTEFQSCEVVEFCDDGYSGTSFERPAMRALLDGVKKGVIRCVIVKDFSRFGRDYITAGDYIEQIFPALGVRFIAVNDRYDSKVCTGISGSLEASFKTLLGDLYSKDLSRKVKSARLCALRKGRFSGAYAFYGYRKAARQGMLIPDAQAAKVVRYIFAQAVGGHGAADIARLLNADAVPAPMVYKQQNGCGRVWNSANGTNYWTRHTVVKILRDERYTGCMVGGKRERVLGQPRTIKRAVKDWTVVSGTHEAIVSKEDFMRAQNALAQFSEIQHHINRERLFYGRVKCGFCGHVLHFRNATDPFYFCESGHVTSQASCNEIKLEQVALNEAVTAAVQRISALALDTERERQRRESDLKEQMLALKRGQQRLEAERTALRQSGMDAYEAFKAGRLDEAQYLEKKQQLRLQSEENDGESKRNAQKTEMVLKSAHSEAAETDIFSGERLEQAADRIVRHITVYPGGYVCVGLTCRDSFTGVLCNTIL